MIPFTHCPHCKSVEYRSVETTTVLEQVFQWLVLPFRCTLCGHHFFLFRWLAAGFTT
jgi:hypothetical protein